MINIFKILCIYIVFFASLIIITKHPIYSILSLISVVFGISLLLFNLEFEFLPYILLIVYIGAVIVLFLFIIMMINIDIFYEKNANYIHYSYVILSFKLTFIFQFTLTNINTISSECVTSHSTLWVSNIIKYQTNDILVFSNLLYTHFYFHTLLISLILLVAMIGSISICSTRKL